MNLQTFYLNLSAWVRPITSGMVLTKPGALRQNSRNRAAYQSYQLIGELFKNIFAFKISQMWGLSFLIRLCWL